MPGIFSVEALESRKLFSGTICLPGTTPPKPALPAAAKPRKPGVSKGLTPSFATSVGVYFGSYTRTNSALAEPETGAFKLTIANAPGGEFVATMEIESETQGLVSRTAPIVFQADGKFSVFFFSARLVMRMEGQLGSEGIIQSKFQGLKRNETFRADVNLSRSQSIVNGQ